MNAKNITLPARQRCERDLCSLTSKAVLVYAHKVRNVGILIYIGPLDAFTLPQKYFLATLYIHRQ